MNDKVQIDAREKGKSWKRLAQHLVIWPKSTQSMKGIPQIHDRLTEQVVVVFLMTFKWYLNI